MLDYVFSDNADSMPVCLNNSNRLEFVKDTVVSVYLPGGIQHHRYEIEGSSWDGATIPQFCWSVIGHPLQKEFRWASFWHDRLCEDSKTYEERRFADAVCLYLLSQTGVSKRKRMAMWAGVRLYGLLVWKPKVHIP